ncbi:MAG TPA: cupin domain-containing protein [Terriglobales bacterium]|nr:cupin domain-containing protein [Terriglobales bacterium]
MNTYMNWFRLVVCGMTVSIAGMAFAQTPASDKNSGVQVMHFDAAKVNASFEKGAPLLPGTEDGHYQILTARREKAGQSELHAKFTDVIYVVEGTATFVTGGEVVDGKTTAPDEIRGESIKGGTTRKLAKGDVIVVPNNTAHQFVEVNPPFLYLVVKVK